MLLASIYLLTSKMCYSLLRGIATFFVKITCILFSGLESTTRLSLQIGLSACNIVMTDVAPSSLLRFH